MNKQYVKYQLKKLIKSNTPARNFLKVREDDIFIVSYPRSGNTWLRFLIGTLWANQPVDWLNMEYIVPDIYRCSEKFLSDIREQRLLKSHHPYDPRYNKVIFIIRNPLDVMTSYYHYMIKFDILKYHGGTFDGLYQNFIHDGISDFGTWKTHAESWLNSPLMQKNEMLVIRYEDIIQDTRRETKKICRFLNIDCNENKINHAIDHASRDNMFLLEQKQQDLSELLSQTNLTEKFVSRQKRKRPEELLPQHINVLKREFKSLIETFNYPLEY